MFILSGTSNDQAVAHAIEIGANDYVSKPIDRKLFAAKLSKYVKTEELMGITPDFIPVPDGGSEATVHLDFDLLEVDEFGMKIRSSHLFSKGLTVRFDSKLLHDISGKAAPLLTTIVNTWLDDATGFYHAYSEFDYTDKQLMSAVRTWLVNKLHTEEI